MAAFNYQDIYMRFDAPLLKIRSAEFIEGEQTFLDFDEKETKKIVYKVDYRRLKCFLDFTCLLYPL